MPAGLPVLNPPPWYLLVSEIKLLLPLGHPLVGDPLLSPSLSRAEICRGGRMVPAAAGGQAAASRGHQQLPGARCPASPVTVAEFGGDRDTHLCSSAATAKPHDANSEQTEEYRVLPGSRGAVGSPMQGSRATGGAGHPRPRPSPQAQHPQTQLGLILPKGSQAVGEDDQRVRAAAGLERSVPAHGHSAGACGEEKPPRKRWGTRVAAQL